MEGEEGRAIKPPRDGEEDEEEEDNNKDEEDEERAEAEDEEEGDTEPSSSVCARGCAHPFSLAEGEM